MLTMGPNPKPSNYRKRGYRIMRAMISAKYLCAPPIGKRDTPPMTAKTTYTILPAKVARGARKPRGGCIAGNLPSHVLGNMVTGGRALRDYAAGKGR